MSQDKMQLAGLGMGSGKKDSFYFCLLEYFPKDQRWFLKNCQQLKQLQYPKTEDHILSWVKQFSLKTIIVDFPLTMPPCYACEIECPGAQKCPVDEVVDARNLIETTLEKDRSFQEENPKQYERERLKLESKDETANENVLSKTLKRKLKKDFIPYWNRPLDAKIWHDYHDDLLNYFNLSFSSFGSENFSQILRFKYLMKHFPLELNLQETNYYLCLLELLAANIISTKDLSNFQSIETEVLARIDILKKIESHFEIFIYEGDKEVLIRKPRAFQSFIITLSGIGLVSNKLKSKLLNKEGSFFLPSF